MVGVALGVGLRLPAWGWAAAVAFALGLIWYERRVQPAWLNRPGWRRAIGLPLGVLLAVFFVGGLRGQFTHHLWGPSDLAAYNDGEKIELYAWVSADPDWRENAVLLQVEVTQVRLQGQDSWLPVRGAALVRLPLGVGWRYGDCLTLWAVPQTPPENEEFSYRAYLAGKGIHTYLPYPAARRVASGAGSPIMAAIYALRGAAYRQINAILPQPEAGLLAGILLGLEKDLPAELEKAFQDTGTAHIIAISGFNMTLLSGLVIGLLSRFFRLSRASLLAALVIGLYTLLVGANPAVVRAAIMGSLAIFGRLIGRPSAGLTALTFTAALMVLFNPLLLGDVSFQLSFTATLGLLLLASPLQSGFEAWAARHLSTKAAKGLAGPVGEYILFTLAAQVMTLPVVLVHFGRFSWSALLANPLILPVQPLVMELGGLALLAGSLWPPLGTALAWPLTAYTIRMVEWVAQLPHGAVSTAALPVVWVVLYYGVLAVGLRGRSWLARWKALLKPVLLLGALGIVTLAAWAAALNRPDGRLHVVLLDVPEAQAALVSTAGGGHILVGGAGGANALADALGREMGPFNQRLDGLLISGNQSAHLAALPAVVERAAPGLALWAQPPADKSATRRLQTALESGAVPAEVLFSGAAVQLDAQATLTVQSQGSTRAGLRLDDQALCVVWAGNRSPQALSTGQKAAQGCILILAEDDLAENSAANWQALRPLAVLVAGRGPAPLPDNWFSTQANGRIEVSTDGSQVWIEVAEE